MLKPLTAGRRRTRLADLGVIRVQGADAVRFLQGQVSNDVAKLAPVHSVLAGLHNPQGRAIALLRFVMVSPEEVLAILPSELAGVVSARLSKFVLRAKAKVSDVSPEWAVEGVEAAGIADELATARIGDSRRGEDGTLSVCVGVAPARWLVLRPVAGLGAEAEMGTEPREHWRALDIADGVPQVYAATSEAFVAQMLNLDAVGGISFEKGCYTGQEVIARAHYRGKVKRRLQRFRTLASASLAIGDSGTLKDGRGFRVVEAVQLADGRCEFLAVAPLTAGEPDESAASPGGATSNALDAESLPLPYAIPA